MVARLLALLLLVLAAACGSVVAPPDGSPGSNGQGSGAGGPGADAPADVQHGAELFATYCVACHGQNAAGGGTYPGSLHGRSGILGQVRNGGGGMPGFPASTLADDDVAAIEAYLAWLAEPGNGGGGGGGPPLSPFAANCAGCHGPTGEGSSLAPQIRSPHEGYAAWVVRNGRNTMGFPQAMPAFSTSQVSDAELDEIFTFLHEQPMPDDGQGLYLRFCGNCHGANGGGGVVGENAREEADDAEEFYEVVRGGHGGSSYGSRGEFMPGRGAGELSNGDVEKIRAYLGGGGGGSFDDDDDDWDDDDDDHDDDVMSCASAGGGLGPLGIFVSLAVLLQLGCGGVLRTNRRRRN